MLNIIKGYFNNDLETSFLINLVLINTWYTLKSQFYQQTDGVDNGRQWKGAYDTGRTSIFNS